MLPNKRSAKWFRILAIYTAVVFLSFMVTRLLLNSALSGQLIIRFALLALGSALLPSLFGYMGRTLFFKIVLTTNLAAIVYMFYIVLADVSPGWGDLTSIAGYLVLLALGCIAGLVAEFILFLMKNKTSAKK